MSAQRHGYGWVQDDHDGRDHLYAPPPMALVGSLPRRVNLAETKWMPPVWDQLPLGSCTAHGVLAAFLYASRRLVRRDPMLSRLQLYYNTRAIEGTVSEDAGAQVRNAIKAAAAGIAPEKLWPYAIDQFATAPPEPAVRGARANIATAYERVPATQQHMMACLADGFPFVDGMPVYESMESDEAARTGTVPLPEVGETLLGYHCTLTVGYDLDLGVWIKRNSWGKGWGAAGYFTVPLAYRGFLSDLWRITAAS